MTRGSHKPSTPPFPLFKRFPSPLERSAYRFYNYLDNSLYPIRPFYFGVSLAAFTAFYSRLSDSTLSSVIPRLGQGAIQKSVRVGLLSLVSSYTPVFLFRSFLRHFYFKYKAWLFENPKKPSLTTKLWGVVREVLSLIPPRLKSCDALLPSPPIPPLEETIQRYLESIRYLHSREEYENIVKMAEEFVKAEGAKLQNFARLYSLFVDNYISGFWEKYAYLYNRECLLISSSVAHVDLFEDTPAIQAVRAAHVVYIEFLSHLAIDRQTYSPLGSGIVCARHYDKMYAVTRIPGENIDCLKNYGISRHVVVLFNGGIFKVDCADSKGRLFTVDELSDIFTELLTRDNTKVEGAAAMIPTLTHDKRASWANNRQRFFIQHPKNRETLEMIESAAFVVCLNKDEDWDYIPEKPEVLSKFLLAQLTGNGADRWVDKSLNYTISKNARCGGTTEHSIADGSEFDHIMENFVVMDTQILTYPSIEEQRKRAATFDAVEGVKKGLKLAEKYDVEMLPEMASEIERISTTYSKQREDVHLSSLVFRDWGKGRLKKCGISPDAFVQMAIQLANYRDQGRFVLTYEAASARFYKDSRTETLRSVTSESCAFVTAMVDGEGDRSSRASLLKKAAEMHAIHNRECMVNKGVDRHLFVLYILSQGTGISSPFLDHYIQQEWLLSTSHVPNVTNTMKEDEEVRTSWLGACFGPVAKTGYGVCYRFAGNHSICAHISSFHSAENTDSDRFRSQLVQAFNDMSALFD